MWIQNNRSVAVVPESATNTSIHKFSHYAQYAKHTLSHYEETVLVANEIQGVVK